MPEVSIIIVSWNTRTLLGECLESVSRGTAASNVEIIVVDNGSTDGSQDLVRQRFLHAHLITNVSNVGFARAVNQGAAASGGRYLLLLNSDAQLMPSTLPLLVDLAATHPRAAVVGPRVCHPDGSFQTSHARFPTLWQEALVLSGLGRLYCGAWYPSRGPDADPHPLVVDYVSGACMLVRRDAWLEAGGLDEGYFMYAEEVDLCYAVRLKGWQVWYHPEARAIHVGGASSGQQPSHSEAELYRSRVRFFRKHYGRRKAAVLKWQIYAFTGIKMCVHGVLRGLSGGRFGRPVVRLRHLARVLADA